MSDATSLQEVIAAVADIVRSVTGVRVSPEYAPEALNTFPASIIYPSTGEFSESPNGVFKGLHNLTVEIHVARLDLSKTLQASIPFGTRVGKAILAERTLSSTCSMFGKIAYTFGPMAWGDERLQTIGWRLTIQDIKTQESI